MKQRIVGYINSLQAIVWQRFCLEVRLLNINKVLNIKKAGARKCRRPHHLPPHWSVNMAVSVNTFHQSENVKTTAQAQAAHTKILQISSRYHNKQYVQKKC